MSTNEAIIDLMNENAKLRAELERLITNGAMTDHTFNDPQVEPVTLEMLDAALDAWFRNNDKGMESGMRAAIAAALALSRPESK